MMVELAGVSGSSWLLVRITDTLEVEKAVEVPKEGGKAGWIVAVVLALVMIFQTVIKTTLKR